MTLIVLSTGQIFCRMSLNWDIADVFLVIRLGLYISGRKTTEVKCHSHQIILRVKVVTVDVNFDHMA